MFQLMRKILRLEYLIRYMSIELDKHADKYHMPDGTKMDWESFIDSTMSGSNDSLIFRRKDDVHCRRENDAH